MATLAIKLDECFLGSKGYVDLNGERYRYYEGMLPGGEWQKRDTSTGEWKKYNEEIPVQITEAGLTQFDITQINTILTDLQTNGVKNEYYPLSHYQKNAAIHLIARMFYLDVNEISSSGGTRYEFSLSADYAQTLIGQGNSNNSLAYLGLILPAVAMDYYASWVEEANENKADTWPGMKESMEYYDDLLSGGSGAVGDFFEIYSKDWKSFGSSLKKLTGKADAVIDALSLVKDGPDDALKEVATMGVGFLIRHLGKFLVKQAAGTAMFAAFANPVVGAVALAAVWGASEFGENLIEDLIKEFQRKAAIDDADKEVNAMLNKMMGLIKNGYIDKSALSREDYDDLLEVMRVIAVELNGEDSAGMDKFELDTRLFDGRIYLKKNTDDFLSVKGESNNLVIGTETDDWIVASELASSSVIYGFEGEDTILGGRHGDIISGGENNDTLSGDRGQDVLYGGKGNDTIYGVTSASSDNGTIGEQYGDTVFGGQGQDKIYGSDDNDKLYGDGDNEASGDDESQQVDESNPEDRDELYDDKIWGNSGYDYIWGGRGNDELHGDDIEGFWTGNDHLYGGSGNDTLDGGKGDDTLEGGTGHDTYIVGEDHDTILDSDKDGVIYHGTGGPQLVGGKMQMVNGIGNDTYRSADGRYEYVFRPSHGAGSASETGSLVIYELTADGKRTGIPLATINDFTNPALGINTQPNRISTREAADNNLGLVFEVEEKELSAQYEISSQTYDRIIMRAGGNVSTGMLSDYVTGSAFDDVVYLGEGNSEVALGNGGDDYIDGGSGRDYIVGGAKGEQAGVSDNDIILGGADNDILHGGAGNDLIYADNKARSDSRYSSEKGDWVNGGLGDDQIHGSRQRDFLQGGAGADLIYGHEGDDVILGDGSIESMTRLINLPNGGGITLREHILQANGVWDPYVILSAMMLADPQLFNWNLGVSTGASGLTDFVFSNAVQFGGSQRQAEGGQADYIDGGDGNDWIAGQTGSDVIYGGAGADIIYGDDVTSSANADDNDFLIGGVGQDTMYGGGANDIMYSDTLFNPSWVLPGSVIGDGEADAMYGGAGNDTMYAGTGGDQLYGEDGDDTLVAAAGNDGLFDGGADDDTMLIGSGQGNIFSGGTGNDTYALTSAALAAGSGSDTIHDADGQWRLRIDSRIVSGSASDIKTVAENKWLLGDFELRLSGNDLIVQAVEYGQNGQYSTVGKMVVIENAKNQAGFTDMNLPAFVAPEPEPENRTPEISGAPDDYEGKAGEAFSFTIPDSLFSDPDGDPLSFRLTLADGSALPDWLVFDPDTLTVSGTAPGAFEQALKVTVSDGRGGEASTDFNITVVAESTPDLTQVIGSEGDNELLGTNGDDYIQGLGGNDHMEGGEGNDVYVFGPGYGHDVVNTWDSSGSSRDILRLEGLNPADVTFGMLRDAENRQQLLITVNATGETLTVLRGADAGDVRDIVEAFEFADGTVWEWADVLANGLHGTAADDEMWNGQDLEATYFGGAGNDVMYASSGRSNFFGEAGDDELYGGTSDDHLEGGDGHDALFGGGGHDRLAGSAGDDTLIANEGDDTLRGGTGQDWLEGGAGDDRYIFSAGDGTDYIKNTEGGSDTLMFEDVNPAELWFGRAGDDLAIRLIGSQQDTVYVCQWFSDGDYKIDSIEAGGLAITENQVAQMIQAMAAVGAPGGADGQWSDDQREALAPVLATYWQPRV